PSRERPSRGRAGSAQRRLRATRRSSYSRDGGTTRPPPPARLQLQPPPQSSAAVAGEGAAKRARESVRAAEPAARVGRGAGAVSALRRASPQTPPPPYRLAAT